MTLEGRQITSPAPFIAIKEELKKTEYRNRCLSTELRLAERREEDYQENLRKREQALVNKQEEEEWRQQQKQRQEDISKSYSSRVAIARRNIQKIEDNTKQQLQA